MIRRHELHVKWKLNSNLHHSAPPRLERLFQGREDCNRNMPRKIFHPLPLDLVTLKISFWSYAAFSGFGYFVCEWMNEYMYLEKNMILVPRFWFWFWFFNSLVLGKRDIPSVLNRKKFSGRVSLQSLFFFLLPFPSFSFSENLKKGKKRRSEMIKYQIETRSSFCFLLQIERGKDWGQGNRLFNFLFSSSLRSFLHPSGPYFKVISFKAILKTKI